MYLDSPSQQQIALRSTSSFSSLTTDYSISRDTSNTTLHSLSAQTDAKSTAEVQDSVEPAAYPGKLPLETWLYVLEAHCKDVKDLHSFRLVSSMCHLMVLAMSDLPIRQFLSSQKAKEIFHEGIAEKLHDILLASRQATPIPHKEILKEALLKSKSPPLENLIKSVALKRPNKRIKLIPAIELLLSKPFPLGCTQREQYTYTYPKLVGKDLMAMGLYEESNDSALLTQRIHDKLGLHLLMQLGQLCTQEREFDMDFFLMCNPLQVFDGLVKTYEAGALREEELDNMLATGMFFDAVGNTEPVHWAISHGKEDFLRKLLEADFDPNVPNEEGKSALARAKEEEQSGMVELLREYGACENNPTAHTNSTEIQIFV